MKKNLRKNLRIGLLFFSVLSLLIVFQNFTAPNSYLSVKLPVEVMYSSSSNNKIYGSQSVVVRSQAPSTQLVLDLHGIEIENEASVTLTWTGAKSIEKIGPIPINNSTVKLLGPGMARALPIGMTDNSYYRLQILFPTSMPTVPKGDITLTFQLIGIGNNRVSGFRVIKIDLQDKSSHSVLSGSTVFIKDNPALWQAPPGGDRKRGEFLFTEGTLLNSPLNHTGALMHCNDCHASDGSDLKYFNYSNESIIGRSLFHGLSQKDGIDIAAYIRGLKTHQSLNGRPWNPPYQPAPGLDAFVKNHPNDWAAGGGIDAVIYDEWQMINSFFPGFNPYKKDPTNPNKIDLSMVNVQALLNAKNAALENPLNPSAGAGNQRVFAHFNPREIPHPYPFLDWNHWLPSTSLRDIAGKDSQGNEYYDSEPVVKSFNAYLAKSQQLINSKVEKIDNDPCPEVTQIGSLGVAKCLFGINFSMHSAYGQFVTATSLDANRNHIPLFYSHNPTYTQYNKYYSPGYTIPVPLPYPYNNPPPVPSTVSPVNLHQLQHQELYAVRQWVMVKLWQFQTEFNLDTQAQNVFAEFQNTNQPGANPDAVDLHEPLAWVVPKASFLTALPPGINPEFSVSPSQLGDYYFHDSWYFMQLVLNPGMGVMSGNSGIDWAYFSSSVFGTTTDVILSRQEPNPLPPAVASLFRLPKKLPNGSDVSVPLQGYSNLMRSLEVSLIAFEQHDNGFGLGVTEPFLNYANPSVSSNPVQISPNPHASYRPPDLGNGWHPGRLGEGINIVANYFGTGLKPYYEVDADTTSAILNAFYGAWLTKNKTIPSSDYLTAYGIGHQFGISNQVVYPFASSDQSWLKSCAADNGVFMVEKACPQDSHLSGTCTYLCPYYGVGDFFADNMLRQERLGGIGCFNGGALQPVLKEILNWVDQIYPDVDWYGLANEFPRATGEATQNPYCLNEESAPAPVITK